MKAIQWHRCLLAGVLLLALLRPPEVAAGPRLGSTPFTLRVVAFVGPKPAGTITQATWIVRVKGKGYTLQVTQLQVLSGDVAYFDIIAALDPYPYAFTVYGDDQALRQVTEAPAGQEIALIGSARLSELPGTLLVSSVERLPVPTPMTSPAAGS